MVVTPVDRDLVDLSTSIANFVVFVEISKLVASLLLDSLPRVELGFDLGSTCGVEASVKLVQEVVLVL